MIAYRLPGDEGFCCACAHWPIDSVVDITAPLSALSVASICVGDSAYLLACGIAAFSNMLQFS